MPVQLPFEDDAIPSMTVALKTMAAEVKRTNTNTRIPTTVKKILTPKGVLLSGCRRCTCSAAAACVARTESVPRVCTLPGFVHSQRRDHEQQQYGEAGSAHEFCLQGPEFGAEQCFCRSP
jgi:hypothetical protein